MEGDQMAAALDNCGHVRIRAATMVAWVKSGSEMRRARAGGGGGCWARALPDRFWRATGEHPDRLPAAAGGMGAPQLVEATKNCRQRRATRVFILATGACIP
jgi:hypothetical protein